MLYVFCDGSITGSHWAKKKDKDSPAYGWTGWLIKTPEGEILHASSEALGTDETMSANVAEHMAVRNALRWLIVHKHTRHALKVHSDSQLVMFQLSGKYQVHNERLAGIKNHTKRLAEFFPQVIYQWIPREQNQEADLLSKSLQIP